MPVLQNRKRPSNISPGTTGDFNGGLNDSKLRRPESPRKRPRQRSSGFNFRGSIKDLRSHRIFSPSSEIYKDVVAQKSEFGLGLVKSEETEAEKKIRKGDLGFQRETEVSTEKCGKSSIASESKTKSFIRPCVRQKVFKAPGSFSYKRLLPYLANMSETNPCDRGINRCPKLDKGLEEKKCQTGEDVKEARVRVTEALVNDNIQKSDGGIVNNLDTLLPIDVDNLLVEKEKMILGVLGDDKEEGKVVTEENGVGISSKAQEGEVANTTVSHAPEGSDFVEDDKELCEKSEDSKQPVSVTMTSFEGQKQTEVKNLEGGGGGNVMNHVDEPSQESNQMTPPDAEMFAIAEEERSVAETADYAALSKNSNLNGKLSNGVNHELASLHCSTRHNISSKCGGVLKPRSRMKLFKSPGSFSYRRMLPYLKDMAKDTFDAKSTIQLEILPEKDLGKPVPAQLVSDNQKTLVDKSNTEFEENQENGFIAKTMSIPIDSPTMGKSVPAQHATGFEEDQEKDLMAQTTPIPIGSPTMDNENLMSLVNGAKSQMLVNAETEESLQVKEVDLDSRIASETLSSISTSVESQQDKSQPVLLLCSTNFEAELIEECAVSKPSQVTSEVDVKSVATVDRPCHLVSQNNSSFPSILPYCGPKRGILKSNPRGCRGICSCLNCASFRLHAERAFEFSRNQMEDAEELVSGLVNKLSYLRNLLEKSADSADDHHISQVKEACKKASEAEEVAKNRISHMNYDLGVHCRITCVERPKVKFANCVEEHIVAKKIKSNVSNDEVLNEETVLQPTMTSKNSCTVD